jgi:hypothetical protein
MKKESPKNVMLFGLFVRIRTHIRILSDRIIGCPFNDFISEYIYQAVQHNEKRRNDSNGDFTYLTQFIILPGNKQKDTSEFMLDLYLML